ncbi:uncharacterized protein LJ206_020399 [Theristicus caerulescens]
MFPWLKVLVGFIVLGRERRRRQSYLCEAAAGAARALPGKFRESPAVRGPRAALANPGKVQSPALRPARLLNACRGGSPCPCRRRGGDGRRGAGLPGCILAGKRKVWRRGATPRARGRAPRGQRRLLFGAGTAACEAFVSESCYGLSAVPASSSSSSSSSVAARAGAGLGAPRPPAAPRARRRDGAHGGGRAAAPGSPPPAPGSPRRGTGPAGGQAAARVTIRVPARSPARPSCGSRCNRAAPRDPPPRLHGRPRYRGGIGRPGLRVRVSLGALPRLLHYCTSPAPAGGAGQDLAPVGIVLWERLSG